MWSGSIFNCQTELILFHSLFNTSEGAKCECNNGAIVGQSLGLQNESYTSQLNVTLSENMIGGTVQCSHYTGSSDRPVIENKTITIKTGTTVSPEMINM